ncbi:Trm112 family protein [Marivirga salinae]|uniref:Trm112 family protein n=1 Tax=Marivirga salinarum TaxID=3059078 RepID=A0AA51NE30_9BACT|nr:Trm112 family protein [Marivirga sp. BDSF4-3]WMN12251.1 Trm112 family protein [Marivirga sp. BDSF4-3]
MGKISINLATLQSLSGTRQSRLLKKMCCPFDKGDLNISIFKQEEEEIIEGLLTCSACQRYFPIIYGIPIMTPDEYRQKSLEAPVMKKWGLELPAGDELGQQLLTFFNHFQST